ncbi:UDP-3-O-(3-hydroxymyristoyl)glucosamine N-acyltransferase [Siculibacillus lacustris]|uniref:UDP-3-O-acylglucosamine N-acyltransferase n=1 Tax=Siculibacillus lacustris TaxID=1549641 RepID=A0A4V2KTS3_9HYPH|nr:UDP-3-O-(3-hydroxymyristoyl)glucosamine N-acyltransferase [Siculibacillus lacustris]TBW38487.1 UDP-3-O-(3-hydroxymyristoyl)glucosamine N-acyltransferase [Siculibacillus lacustris]
MSDPDFFPTPKPVTVAEICAWTGATVTDDKAGYIVLQGVAPLDTAGPGDLTFLDNKKYAEMLAATRAGAVLIHARFAERVPAGVVALVVGDPYRAFATATGRLYPAALRLEGPYGATGIAAGSHVHEAARLEPGVTVEPGAVIGARAEIGTGTVISAGAVIGHDVRIGRNCHVGAGATVIHALIGNRVILHGGVRIGQDGFGFAMGPRGHQKVPQIGRVVIQDDVEIGANTTIDRGANRDTVIGEGTKIDNLVQIAHNVEIGRHCVIVSQVGISGSTHLGDFVVAAGQAGLTGHLKIGTGAQIGAQSGVMNDVPAGARIMGSPSRPIMEFARELATLKKLARRGPSSGSDHEN